MHTQDFDHKSDGKRSDDYYDRNDGEENPSARMLDLRHLKGC